MNPQKPSVLDPDAAPWWEGIARNELRYQRCAHCSAAIFYPRSVCPTCLSSGLSWHKAEGLATIHAVTVVHRAPQPVPAGDAPYSVALVDVDEGFRMLTRIVEANPDDVRVGQRVRLVFREISGRKLPCFRPEPLSQDSPQRPNDSTPESTK
jgi:hypothetical protein